MNEGMLGYPGAAGPIDFGASPSVVRLQDINGFGSVATVIRRFLNVIEYRGNDITYTDSAANGASFTINTSGSYAISYTDFNTAGSSGVGISRNSSQLTTGISTIAALDRLTQADAVANNATLASIALMLKAGDIIRPHVANPGAAGQQTIFCIARIG